MSDKEWYEGLTANELEGKHVQVFLADGTVLNGKLKVSDDYPDVALLTTALVLPDEDGTTAEWPLGVMYQTEDERWLPFGGVAGIFLVWDEREFEPVPGAARVGDYLVIDKSLYEATDVSFQGIGRLGVRLFEDNPDDFEVDSDMFHLVLRRKDTTAAGADHE